MLICWATIRVISIQIKLVSMLIITIHRVNNQVSWESGQTTHMSYVWDIVWKSVQVWIVCVDLAALGSSYPPES